MKVLAIIALVATALGGCHRSKHRDEVREQDRMRTPTETSKADYNKATDPVCGMKVDRTATYHESWDGKDHYFCSDECEQKFKSSPETYVD